MKSHFAGRDFGDGKTSEAEGQIHICEVSLRRRRETSETEKLRKQRGKYIFVKSHFGDEERLREQRDKYIFVKSHFEDEERLRRQKNFGSRGTNTSL